MEPRAAGDIKEHILAGRTAEARALLTISGKTLSSDEHDALNQELHHIETETQGLLNSAERLEQEGKIAEAKAMYEEARNLAMDDPALLAHIRRMDESLLLTRAIKKRSHRINAAHPTEQRPPSRMKTALLAVAACALASAVFFGLTFRQGQQPAPDGTADRTLPEPAVSMPATNPEPVVVGVQDIVGRSQSLEKGNEIQGADAAPAPMTGSPALPFYTVQKGDSLSLIADRNLCNQSAWKAIFDLNSQTVTDPTKLQPGMQLLLPKGANRCPPGR